MCVPVLYYTPFTWRSFEPPSLFHAHAWPLINKPYAELEMRDKGRNPAHVWICKYMRIIRLCKDDRKWMKLTQNGHLSNLKTWQNMTHVNYGLTMVWPSQATAPLARKQLQHWTASCWAHAPFSSQGKESLAPSRNLHIHSVWIILLFYDFNLIPLRKEHKTHRQWEAIWCKMNMKQ